ncbi:tol-pal system-associated acyl-CoA thioesterase [Lichenibacterium dinghuense]|uniref:tol-pal system-associated acyl-CoA thioesterase n=1 Tax=Lichenibacterium dinghuense TaxID=2895977 RepID=UPI001F003EE2|nr:tol-pal system-associated acyl-CoA thioesterase [Lichenibacterium sp. 6Y81]
MSAVHRLAVRVYYEDTDFSGVVYHANYLRYFERGRTELLRDLGVDQASLFAAEPPLGFAVARIEVDFRRPARMDDLLDVETRVAELGGASLTMHQRLTRGGDLLVEATVRVAAVSRGRAARLPRDLADLLRG